MDFKSVQPFFAGLHKSFVGNRPRCPSGRKESKTVLPGVAGRPGIQAHELHRVPLVVGIVQVEDGIKLPLVVGIILGGSTAHSESGSGKQGVSAESPVVTQPLIEGKILESEGCEGGLA